MRSNTSIIYGIAIIGTFFLVYILWNIDYSDKNKDVKESKSIIIDYSKTQSLKRKLSENEYWGKMLFKSKCNTCHKTSRLDNWPDLPREIVKYSSDSLFFNYLTILKSTEDGSRSKPFPQLDIKQTTAIKEYLETLD